MPLQKHPHLSASQKLTFGAKLEVFAAYLAGQGVTPAYHHHMGSIVKSAADIDALMAATGPHPHLLFDAGHCAFKGSDPVTVLARYVDRVAHFQAKNIRPEVTARARAEGMGFLQAVVARTFRVYRARRSGRRRGCRTLVAGAGKGRI